MTGFAPTASSPIAESTTSGGGGGGGTVYTLTGNTAVFSAVIAGQAADDRDLAGSTAHYALAGGAAALVTSYPLHGASGTFALTPAAGTFTRPRRGIGGDLATYLVSINGAAGRDRILNAATGVFVATASAGSFLNGFSLTAASGAFGLTYQLAAASRRTLRGSPQMFAVSNVKPMLSANRHITGDTRTLALTAAAAGWGYGFVLNGVNTSVRVTATIGTMRLGRKLVGASAIFTETISPAALLAVHALHGQSRTLNMTCQLAASRSARVAGSTGTYGLAGGSSGSGVSRRVQGAPGSFLVTRSGGVTSVRRRLGGSPTPFTLVGGSATSKTQKPPLAGATRALALSYAAGTLTRPRRSLRGDTGVFGTVLNLLDTVDAGNYRGLYNEAAWAIYVTTSVMGQAVPAAIDDMSVIAADTLAAEPD